MLDVGCWMFTNLAGPTLIRTRKHSTHRRNKPRSRRRWRLRVLLAGFFALALLCVVYALWASTFDLEDVQHMRERSTVYDMDGKIYSRLAGENRIVVPATKIAKTFQDALLAREDARFYQHHGLDPIGIARAIVRNVTRASASEGASTITQQLARNSFPLGGRTLHRKLLEAFVALRIEQKRSEERRVGKECRS